MKTYHIYYSYKALPKIWDETVKHDIFLQINYLKALENASPNNIQSYYVGFFNGNELVGVAIIQRVQLYLKDIFRHTEVCCFKGFLRAHVSKVVKGNILVVGNLTHTGQHGVFFCSQKMSQSEYLNLLFLALEDLKKSIKQYQNKKIRALMLKDYYEDDLIHSRLGFFNVHKLHKISVQPNMLMAIRPHWDINEHYVKEFNKKYRDRYKRAKKKLSNIRVIELNATEIEKQSKKLHNLYLNVSNNAKFNTFFLPENHFYSLKVELKDRFKLYGYFLNGELVGFYSLILNGNCLETYFLGYDIHYQNTNQLYLNMLYDMVKFAIENRFDRVIYARTAMEIKSSVGAMPKPMVIYIKHTNNFLNGMLKWLFKLLDPTQTWEVRHPFKD